MFTLELLNRTTGVTKRVEQDIECSYEVAEAYYKDGVNPVVLNQIFYNEPRLSDYEDIIAVALDTPFGEIWRLDNVREYEWKRDSGLRHCFKG